MIFVTHVKEKTSRERKRTTCGKEGGGKNRKTSVLRGLTPAWLKPEKKKKLLGRGRKIFELRGREL